jgi:hypothetical protein
MPFEAYNSSMPGTLGLKLEPNAGLTHLSNLPRFGELPASFRDERALYIFAAAALWLLTLPSRYD